MVQLFPGKKDCSLKLKKPIPDPNLSDREFYLRSLTWGLPVNLGGAVVALGMLATGHKPKRFGNCISFEVGRGWGGGSLGMFLFICKDAPLRLKAHEHGHSIQNCYYGPFMPFLVNIPSSSRYWYRKAIHAVAPQKPLPPYDNVWFEAEATRLGLARLHAQSRQPSEETTCRQSSI